MLLSRALAFSIRLTIVWVVCGLFCIQNSFSCDYAEHWTFFEVAKNNVVIKGTVKAHGTRLGTSERYLTEMTVKVTDVIVGEYTFDKAIFVGDFLTSCGVPLDSRLYEIDSEHLFIVAPEAPIQTLAFYGEPSLRIIDNRVNGTDIIDYNSVPYSYDVDDFIASLRSED